MGEFGKTLLSSLSSGLGGGLGSIAGSVGSAISGGLGQLFKSIQDKREHEYFTKRADYQQQLQHETMDKQQQQTIDFWNMQNEYNDPAAVASRYRNAGISPLSAFGGSVVGLGASSAPMPSAGSAYGAGAGGSSLPSMDSPASVALAGSQISKNESDISYTGVLADLAEEKIISEKLAHRIQRVNADFEEYNLDNRKSQSDSLTEKMWRENEKLLAEYQSIMQGIAESYSRERLNDSQRALVNKQIDELNEKIAILQIDKETRGEKNRAEINKLYAEAQKYLADVEVAGSYKSFLDKNGALLDSYKVSEDDKHKLYEATREYQEKIVQAKAQEAKMDTDGFGRTMFRLAQITGVVGAVFGGSYNISTTSSEVNTTNNSTSSITSQVFKP